MRQQIEKYAASMPADRSVYWLDATARFIASPQRVYCHYLQDAHDNIVVMLPLIHNHGLLGLHASLLSCFYCSESGTYGNQSPDVVSALIKQIMVTWRFVQINCEPLSEHDPIALAVQKNKLCSALYYQRFENYFHIIDTDYQGYLQQRPASLRHTIKRKQKSLSGQKAVCQIYQTAEDVKQHIHCFHQVYRQSWKKSEYSSAFIDAVCLAAAQQGELRLGILWFEQKAVAAQIWFVRAGIASIFKLAYCTDYQQLSPGTVLSAEMFRQAIDNGNVRCIDYGMGSEAYKADWMSSKRQRYGVLFINLSRFSGWFIWCRHGLPAFLRNIWQRYSSLFA